MTPPRFKPLIDVSLNEYDENGQQTRFALSPFGNSETRPERIARLESLGSIAPDCASCQREFYPASDPAMVFAPRHTASQRCRSGRRNHCTCDTCF